MSALCQKQTSAIYLITSSARPISVLGMLTPSALAVFRLMYISTLVVACWIGRSPGLSPFQNPAGIVADEVVCVGDCRPVAEQTSGLVISRYE